ncbi:hypothetical protein [Bacillus thuringiensis]|uniref:hypothetical protein n=1 Tax=Bacillus thuringiensis TaxID=1428 RepID=UPI0011453A2F
MIQIIKQKEGVTTVLTGHSFKYRRLLVDGENVEDVHTDKNIFHINKMNCVCKILFLLNKLT